MNVNQLKPVSTLYQKALNEGGKKLRNGNVVRVFKLKDGKKARQVISHTGSWVTTIKKNGEIVKRMQKAVYRRGSNIDTWDYIKSEGKYVSKIKIDKNSCLHRVFNKSLEQDALPEGTITYYKKGCKPTAKDTFKIRQDCLGTNFIDYNKFVVERFFNKDFIKRFFEIKNLQANMIADSNNLL